MFVTSVVPSRLLPRSRWSCAGGMPSATVSAAVTADFADRWVDSDAPLVLRIDAEQQLQWRRWRVFIGTSDVTALMRLASPGVLELTPLATRWAPGEGELVIYDSDDWAERARLPVRVLGAGGFETSTVTPRLSMQLDGRGVEERSDGQPASPRGVHADTAIDAGVAWQGTRNGWTLDAAAHVVGSSHRGKALRAGERGANAPKVDLADYRLALARGGHTLSLGHLSAGIHPLLAQGLNSRGLGMQSKFGNHADVALHVLNGSTVVGWDHFTGLEEAEHQMRLLSLGLELLPDRPAGLRAELSVLDASLLPRAGFNTGTVPDAEESRGFGLRLLGSTADGRSAG